MHVQTDLGDDVTRRDLAYAGNAPELLTLRRHLAEQLAKLPIQLGDLTAQHIDQLQSTANKLGMVLNTLTFKRHSELRSLAAQAPTRHHRQLLRVPFATNQRIEHPTRTRAAHVRHHTGQFAGGIFTYFVDAVFRLRPRLHQRNS